MFLVTRAVKWMKTFSIYLIIIYSCNIVCWNLEEDTVAWKWENVDFHLFSFQKLGHKMCILISHINSECFSYAYAIILRILYICVYKQIYEIRSKVDVAHRLSFHQLIPSLRGDLLLNKRIVTCYMTHGALEQKSIRY